VKQSKGQLSDWDYDRATAVGRRSAFHTTVRVCVFGLATGALRLDRLLLRNALTPEVNLKIAFMTVAPFQVHEIIVENC
jgi:hypothetical protein